MLYHSICGTGRCLSIYHPHGAAVTEHHLRIFMIWMPLECQSMCLQRVIPSLFLLYINVAVLAHLPHHSGTTASPFSYVAEPPPVGHAIYSLIYEPHKVWCSFAPSVPPFRPFALVSPTPRAPAPFVPSGLWAYLMWHPVVGSWVQGWGIVTLACVAIQSQH